MGHRSGEIEEAASDKGAMAMQQEQRDRLQGTRGKLGPTSKVQGGEAEEGGVAGEYMRRQALENRRELPQVKQEKAV